MERPKNHDFQTKIANGGLSLLFVAPVCYTSVWAFPAEGRVTGIYGPFNELYDADSFAESIIDAMVGTYENHESEGSGKTDEHYVNLTKVKLG